MDLELPGKTALVIGGSVEIGIAASANGLSSKQHATRTVPISKTKMGITITGYHLSPLPVYEGVKTIIYRGTRECDRTPVIVKALKAEYPTFEEITRLRYEYKVSHHLDIEGIVKPLALENYNNGLALILEDFGGESLKKFVETKKIGIKEFLLIAIQLASALAALDDNNIIHKDINPYNILINPATGTVKITDFSISTRLSRENQTRSNSTILEGTLAYISPEQTGRMNRSIDYRTDFYSLGVTFYEILTGVLPFTATDPLELVYCHIAKQPIPPHHLNPDIPQTVSSIVMKLLAKTAEDRYQSGYGLKVDLENCFNQLVSTGSIEDFIPGERDRSGEFMISQKLYGREKEVAILMNAFDRVSQGTTEMMLVSGYSGVGKSSLVNEVHKPIVRQQGYFIAGKFDQFKRNVPYVSLIQAFQELMRQLLTESSQIIAIWKKKLLNALGSNGQVIIDVIPEVELIIGQQPVVSQLGPSESQNRFNRVFQNFIRVFTQKEHPLVLFLDDLQWADSASLKLIQLLFADSDSKYLLIIGAYRDNEVSATHPLIQTLEQIQGSGAIVNNIILQPLDLDNVNQLLADTLSYGVHDETQRAKQLADLVFHKTQGNPFFLTQLLSTLHSEKLLNFDFSTGSWQWDIKQIHAIGITDYNVVELIARNMQKLPLATQQVLKLAACIGNQFNLDVLAIVHEKSLSETAADLWDALQVGLILPLSDAYKIPLAFEQSSEIAEQWSVITDNRQPTITYKFLHDRVQQAAYSLIPDDQKKETHLKIGQLLLKNTKSSELEENIFNIVNQLNIGVELLTQQSEIDTLARLNLVAGKRAKLSVAYGPAVSYLNVGLGLLTTDSWLHQYDLAINLYIETAEAEYLNTNFEGAKNLAEIVLQQATNLLDRVKVYELKMEIFVAQNQQSLAIETGIQALEMLGISLVSPQGDTQSVIRLPSLTDLENIPEMTDPDRMAALRILMALGPSIHHVKPHMFEQLALTMLNLCLEHGHCPLAACAYSIYAVFLSIVKGDVESAYHSGQIALRLLEKYHARTLAAFVYSGFYVFLGSCKEHTRTTLVPLREGFQIGLEEGDIRHASFCIKAYCTNIFLIGEPLETVAEDQLQHIELLLKLKHQPTIDYTKIWRQLTLNLHNAVSQLYNLIGEEFNEAEMLPFFQNTHNHQSLFATHLAKLILLYTFKDYAQAVANASEAAKYQKAASGLLVVAIYKFYYSLALLALYPNAEKSEQEQILHQVSTNQEKLQFWAYHAPMNYQHRYDLVEAEKAKALGQIFIAMELYDRAITGAKEQGYIQDEALASELAADFYFWRGREKLARDYLTDAYYGYIRWGATAKVRDLEMRYPQVFSPIMKRENINIDITQTTASTAGTGSAALDLAAVIKASQAIYSEIVFDQLLEKLMCILVKNAGATKGILLLKEAAQLVLVAEKTIDKDGCSVLPSIPYATRDDLPISMINYIEITKESVVLNSATDEGFFTKDPYIVQNQPKSILGLPILHQGKLTGILLLENDLITGAFTPDRLEVLKVLTSQVSISIENAHLYRNLQTYSQELELKNIALSEKTQQLEQAFHKLQQTQTQLVHAEKISSLGQLVAGVAHEVNNPLSFISGNLHYASQYLQDLLKLVHLYQQEYSQPSEKIQDEIEAIELDYLIEDLPKMLSSMQVGADRIRDIMQSLRNFSRVDESQKKQAADIHSGLESTLMILQHRLKAKPERPAIQVVKEYGDLPEVECYAGQINQVFMNILANAIDALEEFNQHRSSEEIQQNLNTIKIRTQVLNQNWVAIRIADNGPGMTSEVSRKLFDPFFTTKPVGKGTGLGLSISYQIVVEKHGGQLRCVSKLGQGTEFIIEIPVCPNSLS